MAIFFYISALRAATERERAEDWQRHTAEVIAGTQLLLSGLQGMETGQRGYLLTLEPEFLEPYSQGQSDTARALPRLLAMTADSPIQQRNFHELAALIKTKQDGLTQSLNLARSGHLDQALVAVRARRGMVAMDDIRKKIDVIVAEQRRVAVIGNAAGDASIETVRRYLNLFALFGSLLLIVTFIAVVTALRGRERAWRVAIEREIQAKIEAERRVAAAALQTLNDELEVRVAERTREFEASQSQIQQMQKLDALGQLTSGIAHDFNNILAAIASGFDLIEKKVDDDHVRMITDHCKAAAFRGAKIVKQMLAFARQEVLTPVPTDLPTLITEIEPLIRQAIPGNIINFDFANDLPKVMIDPTLLEAALLNLAGNANDAMAGGGTLSISATLNDERGSDWPIELDGKDAVILTVHDTGIGMPPEVLQRVVEPFYTTKAVGKGTGLGLAMVQGFVTQSGGALRIESQEGAGTTVRLYLPRALGVSDHAPSELVTLHPVLRGAGAVLLIDDDPNLRPMIALLLQELGYRVTEAANCETALEHIDAETAFDIVLSDVIMAGGDGIVFARAARQRRPHLPILFMTGRADISRLVGETFIYKPFKVNELGNALATLLADTARQRETISASQNHITNIR